MFFMMHSLLIKFYNNYVIIHIQHSSKSFYINYYNIIRASHGQLTSYQLNNNDISKMHN